MTKKVCLSVVLFLQISSLHAQVSGEAIKVDNPVAYCLSVLSECTAANQIKFTSKLPSDLRALNGGRQDPVTLVYNLPPVPVQASRPSDNSLLVAPNFRNECFQFDTGRDKTFCTEKQLTFIPVDPLAKQVLSQQMTGVDIRILKPLMVLGSKDALHNRVQKDRDTALILMGWYLFLTLIAFAQISTRRNQVASLALACLGFTIFARTIVTSAFSFADLTLISPDWDRKIDLITICCIGIFALEFYGQLIGKRLHVARRIYQVFGLVIVLSILGVQNINHALYNLRFAQLFGIVGLILVSIQIVLVSRTLSSRERFVLLIGITIGASGFIVDLITSILQIRVMSVFPYSFAFESLCQFVLIALRNDSAHLEAQNFQIEQVKTQKLLVESLKVSESELEKKVAQRTADLMSAKQSAEQALSDLQAAQKQLIQAEKMASLGLLVGNVAHEINTPIGAVKSSGALIADTLKPTLIDMPRLFQSLDSFQSELFIQLITSTHTSSHALTMREERALTKQVTIQLEQVGVKEAKQKAKLLMRFRAHETAMEYVPLFNHPQSDFIVEVASGIANVINSTSNINEAVERVSRIVYALKTLSGDDVVRAPIVAPLQLDMEKAIAKYQNQMDSVELLKNYQPEMLPIHADHDAMEQLCTHLIVNALQAMRYSGSLTLSLRCIDNYAEIKISDTGGGIADDIKDRIFEPFFTTLTSGEGSGMGLAIVKRIVEQHQGMVNFSTELGLGTTFTVLLPL